ncbi:MAG: Carbapenem antibiotics biosynthesis protein carD [Cytophagales bacterium]|jgi:proline dehydrogenase|nr:proline dehydrogenase family protein [Bacteroidota bacterium]MBS1981048.1 proline dehydrogenase family protein [Bacteroidota bacterium]WHZ08410.1 MAG: Carbapenem antibiotics biosynthesis protein carD [Cytophagales bacterium]
MTEIQFNDTEVAFSYKTDGQLKKANFVFTLVNNPTISAMAIGLVKASLALKLPVKGLIRTTVFEHFCGGETIEASEKTIQLLYKHQVGTILDFAVEGEESESVFDATTREIIRTIEKAKNNPAIPFSVFKVTGVAAFGLLEKIQANAKLTEEETIAWSHTQKRVDEICKSAFENNVRLLIDAEDSWIQNPIDEMVYAMMKKYNKERAIVFNTYQMYRADMLENLKKAIQEAQQHNYFFGAKLVRGAYMEKEAARAAEMNYPNPIHHSKEATDQAFNEGLAFCLENINRVSFMCGSHNEYSNQYLATLMEQKKISSNDPRVWSAQLKGMSDHISFNMAKAGYNVAKYVPYGPVETVMPYLLRRAAENTSVAGQSSRELMLIRKELKRRKNGK